MRSPRGLLAAIVLLLALPVTIIVANIAGGGDAIVVHVMLALGFGLIAIAVFEFRTPQWMSRIACVAASILAMIFLSQAVSEAMPENESLHNFVFDGLRQTLEGILMDVVILWFLALLAFDSEGNTSILGLAGMALVVVLELYGYGASLFGSEAAEIVRVFYLLPVFWLLLESRKKRSTLLTA